MIINTSVKQAVDPDVGNERAFFFIGAFYGLIRMAVCSRVGSVLLDQAATGTIQLLRDSFPGFATVTIKLTGNGLDVQGRHLSLGNEDVDGFYHFLSALRVGALEIERTIAHRQVLQLVKTILNWRLAVLKVPPQYCIIPKTSGAQLIAEQNDGPLVSQKSAAPLLTLPPGVIDAICSEIRISGIEKSRVFGVRDYLLQMMETCSQIPSLPYPYFCWRDIIHVLHKIVATKAISNRNIKAGTALEYECRSLAEIFDTLSEQKRGDGSDDAAQVLFEYLLTKQQQISGTLNRAAVARRKPQRRKNTRISVGTVRQFVNEYKIPARRMDSLLVTDNREIFSVILQRLASDCQDVVEDRGIKLLHGLLAQKIAVVDWEIILNFLVDFASQHDSERFSWLLAQILKGRRNSRQFSSLALCVDLWPKLSVKKQLLVWPHVVHELLLCGADREPSDMFFSATGIASHQPLEVMQGCQSMLEEMVAWREKRIGDTVFRASYIYSYQLFAFLLTTSLAEDLAEQIVKQLQEEPQDDFIALIGPLLRSNKPEHIVFVRDYLCHSMQEELPPALKSAAGRIIIQGLRELSELNKKKPWVAGVIAMMSELRVDESREMLKNICNGRRIGLVPSWPKECRKAAENALQQLLKIETCLGKVPEKRKNER